MLAIDTNIVVRYLTADHPEQSPKAKALIEGEDVFVCITVLLETEWVLRSVYGFTPAQIVKSLAAFAGLPRVTLEDAALAARAIDIWHCTYKYVHIGGGVGLDVEPGERRHQPKEARPAAEHRGGGTCRSACLVAAGPASRWRPLEHTCGCPGQNAVYRPHLAGRGRAGPHYQRSRGFTA